jgi:hypothetical protein
LLEAGLLKRTRRQGVWALDEAGADRVEPPPAPLRARPEADGPETGTREQEEVLVA